MTLTRWLVRHGSQYWFSALSTGTAYFLTAGVAGALLGSHFLTRRDVRETRLDVRKNTEQLAAVAQQVRQVDIRDSAHWAETDAKVTRVDSVARHTAPQVAANARQIRKLQEKKPTVVYGPGPIWTIKR
jgi:hypothetical protein